jgi:hypothetical protein
VTDEELDLQKESVALMRRVANRCQQEEKLAWSLAYVMEHRPREQQTLQVLADVLHSHLAGTVAMVKTIPYLRITSEGDDDGSG